MTRNVFLTVAAVALAGCAVNQPPLLEEDGQYKQPRQTRTERVRQREYQRQLAEQQARMASEQKSPTVEELPAALRAGQAGPAIPAPGDIVPNQNTSHEPPPAGVEDVDLAALERILGEQDEMAAKPTPPVPAPSPIAAEAPDPDSDSQAQASQAQLDEPDTDEPEFAELKPLPQIEAAPDRPAETEAVSGPYFSAKPPGALPDTDKPGEAETTALEEIKPESDEPQPQMSKAPVPRRKRQGTEGKISPPRIVGKAAPSAMASAVAPTIRAPMAPEAQGQPKPLSAPFKAPPEPVAQAKANDGVDQQQVQALQRTAAQKALATVNAFRARHGFEPLVYSEELSIIAQAHVADLAARGEVSALGPNGQTIGVRLLDKGYNPRVAGSVVAGGYPTFDAAFTSWTRNQVEASRLLHPAAKEFGFAVVTEPGSTYRTYIEAIVAAQ